MKTKGSMTCAMSLLLLVIISLLAACIQSSRVSCARSQAANAMGAAMYSLFAQYDRDLLEDYHLFFLDSGYGDSRPNLAQVIAQTETFALPILSSGLTNCELDTCGITGFRLASDGKGEAVKAQILRYMKDNLGTKGMQLIKDRFNQNVEAMEEQEKIQEGGLEEAPIEEEVPMEDISPSNNPLEIIENIRSHGFLGLVLPDGGTVSEKSVEAESLLSFRELEQGMGALPCLRGKVP